MTYEEYLEQLDLALRQDSERMARLHKQESISPASLRVDDEETMRLLAMAGMGGSY